MKTKHYKICKIRLLKGKTKWVIIFIKSLTFYTCCKKITLFLHRKLNYKKSYNLNNSLTTERSRFSNHRFVILEDEPCIISTELSSWFHHHFSITFHLPIRTILIPGTLRPWRHHVRFFLEPTRRGMGSVLTRDSKSE